MLVAMSWTWNLAVIPENETVGEEEEVVAVVEEEVVLSHHLNWKVEVEIYFCYH